MPCIHEEKRVKRAEEEIYEEEKGARNPRSKEMRVINHTSVVQQLLTVRSSFYYCYSRV